MACAIILEHRALGIDLERRAETETRIGGFDPP